MVRLIFRHLTGARSTEVDIVPLGAHRELILGRAPSAAVRFDPQRDDPVGRYHARITPRHDHESRFCLTDLGSYNGTYLNGCRVSGTVDLFTGDIVQLGAGGPTLEVVIELVMATDRGRSARTQ